MDSVWVGASWKGYLKCLVVSGSYSKEKNMFLLYLHYVFGERAL